MQNVVSRGGVYAADRLIEKIQLRLAAHGEDQLHLFLCALGHLLQDLIGRDLKLGEHGLGGRAVEILIKIAEDVEHLRDLHPLAQRDALGKIGKNCVCLGRRLFPVNQDLPLRGLQKTRGELDERCFAAAVGAEQANDTAGIDGKIDVVQRGHARVGLGQIVTFQNRHV